MIGSAPFIILEMNAYAQGVLRLEDEELILEWSTDLASRYSSTTFAGTMAR